MLIEQMFPILIKFNIVNIFCSHILQAMIYGISTLVGYLMPNPVYKYDL